MQGDVVSSVLLPLGLAFIMFTLGIGLTLADFRRVIAQPRAFAVGALCHFLLLPVLAWLLILAFGISGALAVGFMIIAACPTGTTSNLLTYFARGDVALAVSFTAVASVVSVFTVPLILAWSMDYFLGAQREVRMPIGQIIGPIALILALPVALGMTVRARAPRFAGRWHQPLSTLAALVFVAVIIAAIVRNWALFRTHTLDLAPVVLSLNVGMLLLGFGLSRLAGVNRQQAITVAIEASVQNGTLAIVIASSLLRDEVMSLPGAIYGVLMYVGGLAFVAWVRRTPPTRPTAP